MRSEGENDDELEEKGEIWNLTGEDAVVFGGYIWGMTNTLGMTEEDNVAFGGEYKSGKILLSDIWGTTLARPS